jgi:thioredoxin reductase (NADPH)
MPKPVLLVVDDDADVLRTIEHDLRHRFADRYRIMGASSGLAALEAITHLLAHHQMLALLLVDQRMPSISGLELIQQAAAIFPDCKKVLLTAYTDPDVVMAGLNDGFLDHYLMKPYDPPDEKLYPALEDLLFDWHTQMRPYEGIRVVGHRWSACAHRIKDFLARNQVAFRWLDIESRHHDRHDRRLIEAVHKEEACLPIVILTDGTRLVKPEIADLADKIGLKTHNEAPFYDLVILGGGPAGLAAAVYGASEGLSTLLVEQEAPGGQAGTSSRIENYLGFPAGLSGGELARRAVAQARRFGVEILSPQEATGLRICNQYRIVKLADHSEVSCHTLLIATGVSYRRLEVPDIDRLTGSGVYYGAAMTEAMSCQDDAIYIVGGANSAGQAAIYFSRYARTVTLLVRGDGLEKSMSSYLIDEIRDHDNISVLTHTQVRAVHGDQNLEAITIANDDTGVEERLPARAMFIFIGAAPRTDWLAGVVERDANGFILAGPDLKKDGKLPRSWPLEREPFLLETNIPGVFVAGDARHGSVKRVASGVGEGAIAVQFVHQYLGSIH